MPAIDQTVLSALGQLVAAGLFACQVAEEPEDDYRILPGIITDCVDCDTGDDGDDEVCNYLTRTFGARGTACNGGDPGCPADDLLAAVFPRHDPLALGELELADGDGSCTGMTAAAVVGRARLALGGCRTEPSPAELAACAALLTRRASTTAATP